MKKNAILFSNVDREDYCLLNDLFEDDETYKLITTAWRNCRLVFVFENSEGDIKEHKKTADFIYLSE